MRYSLALAILLIFSIACGGGGGGGGGSSEPSVTTFDIRPKTENITWSFTGSDTNSSSYTGQIVSSVGSTTTFSGNSVIPYTGVTTITNTTTSVSSSSTGITYWSTDRLTILGINLITSGFNYLPVGSLTPLPTSADVGDSGTIGTYQNDTDSSDTVVASWTLTQATPSTAYFTVLYVYSDGIQSSSKITIDSSNDLTSRQEVIYYPSVPTTVTLNGTPI